MTTYVPETGTAKILPKRRPDLAPSQAALAEGSTPATTAQAGVVKQALKVAPAAGAAPTAAEYQALLTALTNAGIMSAT